MIGLIDVLGPHHVPSGLSTNIISDISQLLTYHFMVNAFAAGTIVAIGASVIGWFMVLRRQTFAGHTLAVIGFPGAAGAALLGASITLGYFATCVAGAIVIGLIPRSPSGRPRGSESALIGTLQAFALACGVLFVSLYRGFLDQLTSLLFGGFLGITNTQVVTLALVCLVAVCALAIIGRPLFFASIDPDVALARGVPVRTLSLIFMILVGLAVAEASQITGSLLVFALLVMPGAAAQRLTNSARYSLMISLASAIAMTWCALGAAYYSIYPVGFYLTTFGFALYLLALAIEWMNNTRSSRSRARLRGSGMRA
ncbi:MAG TPA: metal ABC transporter permease [Acidimicrobiales bacterium]|nr:metal ABC transporter permease [Acidimicrobiales bacterium]